MKPSKKRVQIKLNRQLYDLFQSSRVNCNGWCCGWNAFNLSDHWLGRWCEFREESEIHAVYLEIQEIRVSTDQLTEEMGVEIADFLRSDIAQLRRRIGDIEKILKAFAPTSCAFQIRGVRDRAHNFICSGSTLKTVP